MSDMSSGMGDRGVHVTFETGWNDEIKPKAVDVLVAYLEGDMKQTGKLFDNAQYIHGYT
jgi:hypothetical protein